MDIVEIQAIYYMVAATGVLIAAVFYILNMRETMRNRRATLTNNLIQPFTTREFSKTNLEIEKMKWDSFEDFKRKYDSRVNPDNYEMRQAIFNLCDSIGYQYRSGLIDVETVYHVAGLWIGDTWDLFGDVIREYRKSDYPADMYENWEYIAKKLTDMRIQRDGEWLRKRAESRGTH